MTTEIVVNGLQTLSTESNKEMDSSTAREKLLQAFNLADKLALEMQDPIMVGIIGNTIYSHGVYIDNGTTNHTLGCFCNLILFTWKSYVERMKAEEEEMERKKTLTELRKQGKI